MRINEIKQKANLIYHEYRTQIIPEFFYVGYVSLLAQYLRSGFFSFFVSLFLCPISHGYVKCSMTLVDQPKAHIDYHDSMIGVMEFPRVAPAYLMRKVIILTATLLCALPSLFPLTGYMPELSFEWFASLGNSFIQTEFFLPNLHLLFQTLNDFMIVLNILGCILVYLGLTALFMPIPYIMELEEFSWSECMIYSVQLMKKNMFAFFKLYLVYAVRHFIYWFVTGLILMILGSMNEILMLFCMVTSLFLYIDIFKGRFEIAKYLFYQEMRGDKNA